MSNTWFYVHNISHEECLTRKIIDFGKHAGKIYEHVLSADPNFCEWVIDTVKGEEDTSESMSKFAEWLNDDDRLKNRISLKRKREDDSEEDIEDDFEVASSHKVGFGAYSNETFGDIMRKHKKYVKWAMTKANDPATSKPLRRLIAFLVKFQTHDNEANEGSSVLVA